MRYKSNLLVRFTSTNTYSIKGLTAKSTAEKQSKAKKVRGLKKGHHLQTQESKQEEKLRQLLGAGDLR